MVTVTENTTDGKGTRGNRSGAYRSWTAMRWRCNQKPGHRQWKYYGAKGIKVCERWNSFSAFLEDLGPRPDGHTLDRRDGDKDYCKENCRWASWSDQNLNKKFSQVEHEGEMIELKKYAREAGLNYHTIHSRIHAHGWSVGEAIKTPVATHEIEFNGRSMTITKWAEVTGIPRATLMARIHRDKWPIERALTENVRGRE